MVIELFNEAGDIAYSPFIVPVAGCIMIAAIVIAGSVSGTRRREIESQERLAAIAKGLTPPPTREELERTQSRPLSSATRRYSNIRLAGIITTAGAVALILFFCLLSFILKEHDVLAGAACGLIPLGIGVGLLVDARLQKRELEAPPS